MSMTNISTREYDKINQGINRFTKMILINKFKRVQERREYYTKEEFKNVMMKEISEMLSSKKSSIQLSFCCLNEAQLSKRER